jgi:hypothetical protein
MNHLTNLSRCTPHTRTALITMVPSIVRKRRKSMLTSN